MPAYGLSSSSDSDGVDLSQLPDRAPSKVLVVDTGSKTCCAGYANGLRPSVVTNFATDPPIQRGRIVDWDKLEDHWWQILHRRDINYDENPLLFTVSQIASRQELEMIAQIAFESFNTRLFQAFNQSLLALYACGKRTGLILDCGHELTHSVPIYRGAIYYPGVVTLELGGADLTRYLETLMGPHERIEEIKEKACEVLLSKLCVRQWKRVEHELSNRQVITLGPERFKCPEPLFTPSLLEQDPGPLAIHEAIYQSIRKCDVDIQEDLYARIFLTGGSAMFPGLDARLKYELEAITPSRFHSKLSPTVLALRYASWAGGSVAALSIIPDELWHSKKDYNECGPSIVHYKCSRTVGKRPPVGTKKARKKA